MVGWSGWVWVKILGWLVLRPTSAGSRLIWVLNFHTEIPIGCMGRCLWWWFFLQHQALLLLDYIVASSQRPVPRIKQTWTTVWNTDKWWTSVKLASESNKHSIVLFCFMVIWASKLGTQQFRWQPGSAQDIFHIWFCSKCWQDLVFQTDDFSSGDGFHLQGRLQIRTLWAGGRGGWPCNTTDESKCHDLIGLEEARAEEIGIGG